MDARDGPRPWRRFGRSLSLWAAGLAVAVGLYVDRQIVDGFADGRCRDRVRVYAAPRTIEVGTDVRREAVTDELDALGYRRVHVTPSVPGTYQRSARRLDVFLRAAARPGGLSDRPAELVRIELDRGRVRGIELTRTAERVETLDLDPRLLDGVLEAHWAGRAPLDVDDLPPHVVDAVLAAEDEHFLHHAGLDWRALLRALRVNWEAGAVRQGGSTITQQLVKNHFLTQERTFARKLREIPMALALEWRFDKRQILECYLSTVYLGHDRLVGVYGFAEGARAHLGKHVSELSLGEAAMLAGMIRAPNALSPARHPERALRRRDQVLAQLEELGWASPEQLAAARAEPAPPAGVRRPSPFAAHFLANVLRELDRQGLAPGALPSGSAVFTTLDVRLQGIVEDEVRRAAAGLDVRAETRGAEIAVVALDPRSGAVRSLVGGRDYLASQLDRATQARRQVGSLFKPFVVLAAIADPALSITPATLLDDAPLAGEADLGGWSPQNHDRRFRGPVTVREALEDSLNPPMVRLARRLGLDRVAGFAETLALGRSGLPRVPSLALGAFGASLLDVASAYSLFPGAGRQVAPQFLDVVKAPSGAPLWRAESATRTIVDTAPAYVVHSMLEGVFRRGTARAARGGGARAGVGAAAVAGKTGTTDGYRDAWVVGYTENLLLAVWVGRDDEHQLGGSASRLALPVWTGIMRRALATAESKPMRVPEGVELVRIDAATGLRASPGCGRSNTEAFLRGTAPLRSCTDEAAAHSSQRG